MPTKKDQKNNTKIFTIEQEDEIFIKLANGEFWSREKTDAFILENYQIQLSKGALHSLLKSFEITIASYGFPKICTSEKIVKWFLNDHALNKLRAKYSTRYKLYWIGTKKVREKWTMVYLVSMQGKIHWKFLKGNFTEKKQLKLLETLPTLMREELGQFKDKPKRIILLRTNIMQYAMDIKKHRWGNVPKIYPNFNIDVGFDDPLPKK